MKMLSCLHNPNIIGAILFSTTHAYSADLAKWDLTALPGNQVSTPVSTQDISINNASAMTRGSGLSADTFTNSMNSSSWTTNNNIDDNEYYEFSLTPAIGMDLNIDTLYFAERRSLSGIRKFELRSSRDQYTSTIGSSFSVPDDNSVRQQAISLGSDFDSVSAPIIFRLYGYASEASTGTWRLENHTQKSGFLLEGTSTPLRGNLSLSLTNPVIVESGGTSNTLATITRSGDLSNPLTVQIYNSQPTQAYLSSSSITIPALSDTSTFTISATNDSLPDGNIALILSASAPNYLTSTASLRVDDDGLDSIKINEIDSNTPAGDNSEFIELYNPSNQAQSLDGKILVLFDGKELKSYRTINLDGKTIPAKGFFVIGNASVPLVNMTFATGTLQNGADAVALYEAAPAQAPNGTLLSTAIGTLVDAAVYGNNHTDSIELLNALTPGKNQLNESANAQSSIQSLARQPDGGVSFDSTLYVAQAPTPGFTNAPLPSNTYANWQASHFNNETDPLIIGFNADPDHDQIPNSLEALMGGNPMRSEAHPITAFTQTENGFNYHYPQSAHLPSGLTAVYEWSTDMIHWQNSGQMFDDIRVDLAATVLDNSNPEITLYQVSAQVITGSPRTLFTRLGAKN